MDKQVNTDRIDTIKTTRNDHNRYVTDEQTYGLEDIFRDSEVKR